MSVEEKLSAEDGLINLYNLTQEAFGSKFVVPQTTWSEDFYLNTVGWMKPTRPFTLDSALFLIKESYWIKSIEVSYRGNSKDIRLRTVDHNTKEELIYYPTKRDLVEQGSQEIVMFELSIMTEEVILMGPESIDVSITGIRIWGKSLIEAIKTVAIGQDLLAELDGKRKEFVKYYKAEFENYKQESDYQKKEATNILLKVNRLKTEEEELGIRLESLNKQASDTQDFLKNNNERLNKTNQEISQNDEIIDSLNAKKNSIEFELKELTKTLSRNEGDINEQKALIEKYKNKAQLYSEDFTTLKSTVFFQTTIYLLLLAFVAFFGWHVVDAIYEGAMTLALETEKQSLALKEIWPLLVSRLPVLGINLFLLGMLSTIAHMLMKHIIQNNEDVKTVQSAAYLVKETINRQRVGLNLKDDEIFEQRVNSKMNLIHKLLDKNSPNSNSSNEVANGSFSVKIDEIKKMLDQVSQSKEKKESK
ncbi:hypothetical protein [Vibrio parahaemolyticus]|uniref:hypothetical protein n=3 Tax=Vibrio parahaemolyticus TaxID=670 RepID=UPI00084B9E0B|nr:hypothetical protein [Vibrio parahaemolyticus]EJU8777739.1 hypothetical protein [Vibrio parahaemolyticus]ODY84557.1 hypothetical protein BBM31_11255 [Vibrio parahaemolyticus]